MSSIGEVLMTARRASGLTQEELASRASVTQAALSRYENGLREPEPEVLSRLASGLGLTESFFHVVGRAEGAMAVDAHMRRRQTARAREWRRLEARLNMYRFHVRRLYDEVSLHTDQRIPQFDSFETDPATAAHLVRMQWRLPVGPVRSLIQWVESAGCLVIEEDFGTPRVDGLSQWVEDHPIILLNIRTPTDRKRLTIAHELGHLCLHSTDVNPYMEREADEFAAEFLMPADVIRPQLRKLSLGRLQDLKREWGVSIQALVERARELGTITVAQRTNFYKQFSMKGWRTREPVSDELTPEHPTLAQAIGDTLASKGLTIEEIGKVAGFSFAWTPDPPNLFQPSMPRLRSV
jgi:Zn-dependent peptidase ImmA (M78 family)/transcriptional regulator with XRE-family HTH domain